MSRRLDEIPGVGPLIATALVASIPDPHAFRSQIAGLGAAEPLAGDALDLAALIKAGDGPVRDQPQVVVGFLANRQVLPICRGGRLNQEQGDSLGLAHVAPGLEKSL